MKISAINTTSNFQQTICRQRKDGVRIVQESIKQKDGTDVSLITYYNTKGLLVACNDLARDVIKQLVRQDRISRKEANRRISDLADERCVIDSLPGSEIFCQIRE